MQDYSYFMGKDGFTWFVGCVEDRNDPERLGRVRVRCLGYHTEDKSKIPTEDLPWASVMMPVTTPSMNGLGETPSFLTPCLLYTSPSPRDNLPSRMPSSA